MSIKKSKYLISEILLLRGDARKNDKPENQIMLKESFNCDKEQKSANIKILTPIYQHQY